MDLDVSLYQEQKHKDMDIPMVFKAEVKQGINKLISYTSTSGDKGKLMLRSGDIYKVTENNEKTIVLEDFYICRRSTIVHLIKTC